MSQDTQLIKSIIADTADSYVDIVALCLYCYDFMLTFDQQIRFFKGRKFSISTVLFVMLHMTGFLAVISLPLAVFVPSIKSYWAMSIVVQIAVVSLDVITTVLIVLRLYAIEQGRKIATFVVLALFVVVFSIEIYIASTIHLVQSPDLDSGSLTEARHTDILYKVAAALSITAHLFTVLVTWKSTYAFMRLIAESGQQRSIQGLLLRDGTMHFGIMLAVEIANTIPAITDVGYLDGLNDISQVILLSRFFLNLRNTIHATLDTESNPSDLRFSLKQSFGGSIDFGDGDDAVAEGRDGDDEDIEEFACDGHSPEDIGTENGSHHGEL